MTDTPSSRTRFASIGSLSGLLAVTACYGTLAAVALLSLIGINVDLDEDLMVKLISGLLVLVLAGMAYSFRVHRHPGPLLLSIASAAVLVWVFFVSYSKVLEMGGFAILLLASLWDWRLKKQSCAARCGGAESSTGQRGRTDLSSS